MSLLKTLAKVAIGVAIAKGVGAVMQGAQGGGAQAGAGRGGSFGGPSSPGGARTQTAGAAPGGLEDIMGQVLGGRAKPAGQASAPAGRAQADAPDPMGGLGGLLEQLAGGAAGRSTGATRGGAGGGLDDLLGQLAGAGGLGGILGGLAGAAGAATGGPADVKGGAPTGSAPATKGGAQPSFGDLLNQSLQNYGEPDVPPAPAQEAAAALMLRAMIQAAKADGKVDEGERKKLLENLSDATEAEMTFVKNELAAPVSIDGLVKQVPKGLENQVYTMSVMAIALDNKTEAQYLHELAQGLGLGPQQVNQIHGHLGVPALYS
jgi:uncharacterized membrane protein YebE (DUF533 family)